MFLLIKLRSLLVVQLSLRSDFPQSFGIACLAILYLCLNLVRSSLCGTGEIRKALPILLS